MRSTEYLLVITVAETGAICGITEMAETDKSVVNPLKGRAVKSYTSPSRSNLHS